MGELFFQNPYLAKWKWGNGIQVFDINTSTDIFVTFTCFGCYFRKEDYYNLAPNFPQDGRFELGTLETTDQCPYHPTGTNRMLNIRTRNLLF